MTAGQHRVVRVMAVVVPMLLFASTGQAQTRVQALVTGGGGTTVRADGSTISVSAALPVAGTTSGAQLGFQYLAGRATATAADAPAELPDRVRLHQNYPNPFNPQTTVAFELPAAGPVRIEVFDLLGRLRLVALDSELAAGRHDVTIGADELESGLYVYRLAVGERSISRSMVVLK